MAGTHVHDAAWWTCAGCGAVVCATCLRAHVRGCAAATRKLER